MPGRPREQNKYNPPSFDNQADKYDRRTGLTEMDCRKIVGSVLELAEFKPKDLVVEIGAGTGQIGQWFTQFPVQYIGFDLSTAMLSEFRQRLDSGGDKESIARFPDSPSPNVTLVQADGNQRWPVDNGTVRVIFSSRAIHLLKPDCVLNEVFRVAKTDGAVLIIGRIQRSRNSIKAQMKQALQRLLRHRGLSGPEGEKNQNQLIEVFCRNGAFAIAPVTVSQWAESTTPNQSLNSWREKSGLGGIDLPSNIKEEILDQLQTWAQQTYGNLDQSLASESAYVLQGVRLSANG